MSLSLAQGTPENARDLKTKGITMSTETHIAAREAAVSELNGAYENLLTGSNRTAERLATATSQAFAAMAESFNAELQRFETEKLNALRDDLNTVHGRLAALESRI